MQMKRVKRRRYAAPVGGAFIALALVGVITVVVLCIQFTARVLDNAPEKESFGEMIRPVVMFDPVPFESPEDVSMNNLLMYSMWATLRDMAQSDADIESFYNDMGEFVVKASDMDVAAGRLFGPGIVLEHQDFGDYESRYSYYPIENVYGVQITAKLFVYSPSVREIVKEGVYYVLTVDYIPPGDAWSTTFAGSLSSPSAEKTMLYLMTREGESYYLAKVRDVPADGAVVEESQPEEEDGQSSAEEDGQSSGADGNASGHDGAGETGDDVSEDGSGEAEGSQEDSSGESSPESGEDSSEADGTSEGDNSSEADDSSSGTEE